MAWRVAERDFAPETRFTEELSRRQDPDHRFLAVLG